MFKVFHLTIQLKWHLLQHHLLLPWIDDLLSRRSTLLLLRPLARNWNTSTGLLPSKSFSRLPVSIIYLQKSNSRITRLRGTVTQRRWLLYLFKWFLKPPTRLSESIKAMRWACGRLSKPLIKTTHLVVGLIGFASSYYLVWMYRTNFLLTSRKCKVFTDILPLLYLTSTHCSQAIFLRLFLLYLCLLSCYLLVFCWWVTQSHHPMRLSMSTTRMTLSQRILARLRPPRLLSLEPKQRTKTCPRVSPSNNNSKLHCSFCKQDGHNLEQCSTAWEILDENHSCPTRNWQDHQFGSKKSGKSAKAGKVETTTIEGGSCQALSPNPGTIGVQKITTHGSVSRAILVTRLIQLMVQCQEL